MKEFMQQHKIERNKYDPIRHVTSKGDKLNVSFIEKPKRNNESFFVKAFGLSQLRNI